MGPSPDREASVVAAGAVHFEPDDRGRERCDGRRPGIEVRRRQHLEGILQSGRKGDERQERRIGLRESGDQDHVVVRHVLVAQEAVPGDAVVAELIRGAFADHAEPVGIVQVQEGVVLVREAGECRGIRRVAGHRVDTVHRDQARLSRVGGGQQLFEMRGVVVPEPDHVRAVTRGDHGPVVDRLVRPAVQEHGAVAHEDRDHRHVDVRDRGEEQDVFARQQVGHLLFDLLVETRAAEETRPAGMGSPLGQVFGDRGDDLLIEIEPQVVAGRPVREPLVADPDLTADLLVDHGVDHRVLVLQPREVRCRGHPAVEPSVHLAAPGLVVQRRPDREVGLAPLGARIGPVRAGSGFGGRNGHLTSPSATPKSDLTRGGGGRVMRRTTRQGDARPRTSA